MSFTAHLTLPCKRVAGACAGTMWVHSPRAVLMRQTLDDPKIIGTHRSVTTSFAFSGKVSGALHQFLRLSALLRLPAYRLQWRARH